MKTVRITELGMFLAIALVLSYVESLLPIMVAVPGVKIGLANIITMILLYHMNFRSTLLFMMVRVLLSGFLFSGLSSIFYSFAGGLLCIIIMSLLKRFPIFSVLGVSMAGAIFHNVGQLLVALFVVENIHILYYLPILCVSGAVSGLAVGYVTYLVLKRYNNMDWKRK